MAVKELSAFSNWLSSRQLVRRPRIAASKTEGSSWTLGNTKVAENSGFGCIGNPCVRLTRRKSTGKDGLAASFTSRPYSLRRT